MKKILLSLCFLSLCTVSFANKTDVAREFKTYGVITLGPIFKSQASLALGIREQNKSAGWGIEIGAGVGYYLAEFKASLSGFYYPHPDPKNQYFCGIGVAGLIFVTNKSEYLCDSFVLCPELIFGKEFMASEKSKHFAQVEIMAYHKTVKTFNETTKFTILGGKDPDGFDPRIYLSYGIYF